MELILPDADVAGLVQRELDGGLDGNGIAILWACITALDKIVPLIDSGYCASYFAKLRTMAKLAAARLLPTATYVTALHRSECGPRCWDRRVGDGIVVEVSRGWTFSHCPSGRSRHARRYRRGAPRSWVHAR